MVDLHYQARIAGALHGIWQELEHMNDWTAGSRMIAWKSALLQLRRAVYADQYIDSGESIEDIITRLYTLAGIDVPDPLDPDIGDPRRRP